MLNYRAAGIWMIVIGLSLLSIPSLVVDNIETETYSGLCVDGDGDINLEGIMCEKTTTYIFGYGEGSFNQDLIILVSITIFFIGMVCILCGITYILTSLEREK